MTTRPVASETVQPLQRLGRGGPQRHDADGPPDLQSGDPPVEVVADPAPRIADAPVHERAPGEPEGDRAGRQGGGAVRDHEVDAPRRPAEGEERRGSERTPAQRRDRQLAFPSARAECGHRGGEAACPELPSQLGCLDLRSPAVVGRRDDEHRRALPRPQPRATAPSWPHDEQSPVPPEEEGVLPPRGACPGDDGTQAEVADPPRGSMARVRLRSGRRPLPGERSVGPTVRHPLAQQLAGGARESVVDQGRLGVVQLLPGRAGPPAEIDVLTGEGERLVEATEGAEHGPLDSQGAAVPPRSHGTLAQARLLCEVPWRSMPRHR